MPAKPGVPTRIRPTLERVGNAAEAFLLSPCASSADLPTGQGEGQPAAFLPSTTRRKVCSWRADMNKDQIKKLDGYFVRLQPHALGPHNEPRDDDWLVTVVTGDDALQLTNMNGAGFVMLGLDHVYSYFTDKTRGGKYGYLQLLSQVRISDTGTVSAEPLPPPKVSGSAPVPKFNPLVVNDGFRDRLFTWHGRDPVHLATEDDARQLGQFFVALCDALRHGSGREPEFQPQDDIRDDVVYELTPDHRARHRLLGGMGGGPGKAVLVLTNRPAYGQSTETLSRHDSVRRLIDRYEYGVHNLLNRSVGSIWAQNLLDSERQQWVKEVAELLEKAGATPSEVTEFRVLHTFAPKGLGAVIDGSAFKDPERATITSRNAKHRDEMSERLDRLLTLIKKIEQR